MQTIILKAHCDACIECCQHYSKYCARTLNITSQFQHTPLQEAESESKRVIQLLNEEAGDTVAVDEIRISPGKLEAVSNSIVTLWKDEGFRQCFRRSKEYQLIDSAKYYLDKAAQICDPSFHPTDQDILR